MDIQLITLLLGLFVGILLSLTGAGGGVVSVPLLVIVLHLPVAEASPIGLLAVMMAAGVGAIMGLRQGIVRYKAAALMAGFGIVFSPLGIWLAHHSSNTLLTILFSIVLLLVALRMLKQATLETDAIGWLDDRPPPPCELDKMRGKLRWTAPCARSIMVAGSIAGFLSGLLGVGGGFVIVPALRSFTNLDIKSIVATSLATITLVSAAAFLISSLHGLVNWERAWPFADGAAIGMLAGSFVAHHLTGPRIQQMFAIFALFVSFGLLFKLFY